MKYQQPEIIVYEAAELMAITAGAREPEFACVGSGSGVRCANEVFGVKCSVGISCSAGAIGLSCVGAGHGLNP